MNNLQAAGKFLTGLGRHGRQVLLQQLHVDVERAKRITDLMGQLGQQPGEQQLLFRRGQMRGVVAQLYAWNSLHRPSLKEGQPKGEF